MRRHVETEEGRSFLEEIVRWWFYRNRENKIEPFKIRTGTLKELMKLNEYFKERRSSPGKGVHLGIAVKKKIYNKRLEKNLKDFVPGEFYLPDSWRDRHFLCFGTTGSGKTKLMTYMIYQDIMNGKDVIVLNPKSDPLGRDENTAGNELLSYVVQACVRAGRLDELLVVTPIFPEYSLRLNPLRHFKLEEELIQHVISSMPPSKEAFYENVAYEVSTAIIVGLVTQERIQGRNPSINFMDIKERVDYAALQILGDQLEYFKHYPDPTVREKVNDTVLTIRQMGHSPQDFFSKISSSLRTVMTTLTSSVTGEIIGKARDNLLVDRLQAGKGVVFVCNTDNVLMPRSSHIINRTLVSMAIALAGRRASEGMAFARPLCIYVDEGHNVLFKGIEELFGKGRSAGMYLHLFTQSRAEIEKVVGEQITESILNNINIWVIMKTNSASMQEYVESTSPTVLEWIPYPDIGGGRRLSIMFRAKEVPLISRNRVMELKTGFYFLKYEGTFYKGQVPWVPPPSLRVVMPTGDEGEIRRRDQ